MTCVESTSNFFSWLGNIKERHNILSWQFALWTTAKHLSPSACFTKIPRGKPQQHTWLTLSISCWRVTPFSRHSVRQSLQYAQSNMAVCRNLLGLWLLKHWKIRTAYGWWRSNFPRRRRKPKGEKLVGNKLRLQLNIGHKDWVDLVENTKLASSGP